MVHRHQTSYGLLLTLLYYLLFQIATLVQHRSERPHVSTERTLRAIGRVGQAVSLAVERFVCVGETIGDDNPEIRQDMYEACKEARSAGNASVYRLDSNIGCWF